MKRLFRGARRTARVLFNELQGDGSQLSQYIDKPPSKQNAIDLFKGKWNCALPPASGLNTGAGIPTFDDSRVTWALGHFPPLTGMNVLELGPLEAGHTMMLIAAGAEKVTAIEANAEAYLKCLVVKETLGLTRASFELGDFMATLREDGPRYDLTLACGVLYHVQNPLELLGRAAHRSKRIFVWTHYYDAERAKRDEDFARKISREVVLTHDGYAATGYRIDYQSFTKRFCGGTASFAVWLTREAILQACERYGYQDIQIGCEEPGHPGGPAFAFTASLP